MCSWEDDVENERLIKVVVYLEPLTSKELLYKFPDNSTLNFDYSQSTIWSPLVPRPYNSMDLDVITPIKLRRLPTISLRELEECSHGTGVDTWISFVTLHMP